MPTFSFVGETSGGTILSTTMSESSFAKHISPQPSEEASNEVIVDLTKKSSAGEANKENVAQDLLTEVARTWTAGKGNRQTKQAKAAVKNARQSGLAPSKIAKHVVDHLEQCNQPTDGEDDRVREFAYNINKQLKKERETTQAATQKKAATSTASTDLSLDEVKPGAPTNLEDLMPAGIPFQQNGVIYSKGDKLNKKRKASTLEQHGSTKTSTKHMDVESMNQERHWMMMWKDSRAELKKLREELKGETDDEVLTELKTDIESLQKKKDEWAKLLGMKE